MVFAHKLEFKIDAYKIIRTGDKTPSESLMCRGLVTIMGPRYPGPKKKKL